MLGARGDPVLKLTAKGQYRSKVDPSLLEGLGEEGERPRGCGARVATPRCAFGHREEHRDPVASSPLARRP